MTLFPISHQQEEESHRNFKLMQALHEEIKVLKNEIRLLVARVDEQRYILAYHEQCRINTLY